MSKLSRIEIVDTADHEEVVLAIPTAAIRRAGRVDAAMLSLIEELVLGRPVAASQLDPYGMTAVPLYTPEEAEAEARQGNLFAVH